MVFRVVAGVVYGSFGYCYGAGRWLLWCSKYFLLSSWVIAMLFPVVGTVLLWYSRWLLWSYRVFARVLVDGCYIFHVFAIVCRLSTVVFQADGRVLVGGC